MIIVSSPKNKLLLGDNNKALNRRVLAVTNLDDSTLVVDLHYYSSLVANKLKYSSSFGRKWASLAAGRDDLVSLQALDDVFEPITKLKRIILVKSTVLLCKDPSTFSELESIIFTLFAGVIDFYIVYKQAEEVSALYSLAVTDKQRYLILTDNLNFWSICSKKSDIHHCVVTKNNNIKLYTEKFGLEYLSSLIQTNKLVNKLRLSKLKYVNLQYLFLLLLYTKFKQVKANEQFDLSDKRFLGSKGKGLQLLSDSHREISYYFLTKQDMAEIFLFSSATHFTLNLSRLLKITPFDLTLLGAFANYYGSYAVRQVFINKASTKVTSKIQNFVKKSKLLSSQNLTPRVKKQTEKTLPPGPLRVDISGLETSMAVDSILKDLSW